MLLPAAERCMCLQSGGLGGCNSFCSLQTEFACCGILHSSVLHRSGMMRLQKWV